MKLLGLGIKVVERVLEIRLCRIVTANEMQFGFMPERGTIDAVYILRRLQEEYYAKGKSCICLEVLEKVSDRVPRTALEWASKKKSIPEDLVRSVMCLYEGAKTRVRVGSELSEEFEVIVRINQGSVLFFLCFSFLFIVVVDVVTDLARDGVK